MEVSFYKAKNGSETCSVLTENSRINLHSSYNPEKEAERFAESVTTPFNFKYILVTEPALSYCADYLRKKFPDTKLLAVRYTKDFAKTDKLWDKVFYFSKSKSLENEIFNYLGEDEILTCLFLQWQASSSAFAEENQTAWNEIKAAVSKASAVLNTRTYFAKRWLNNSINFFSRIKKTCTIKHVNCPVLVAASGRSLQNSIRFIKKYRNDFFLIAVSSAIKPLLTNGVFPDICISTDGGYWAKKHLEILLKPEYKDIPLALTGEAACPSKILETRKILPLTYSDFLENLFFAEFKIQSEKVYRNGSVSGTAALFALSLTDSSVYFCGLDMAENKGFQHTMPNALEEIDSLNDFRLSTKHTRLKSRELHSDSMEIYRNWFSTLDENLSKRIFRIADDFKYSNRLGKIQDLNWREYKEHKEKNSETKAEKISTGFLFQQSPESVENRKKTVWNVLKKISTTDEWLKNAFPNDYLTFTRALENKETLWKILLKKNDDFLGEIKARVFSD